MADVRVEGVRKTFAGGRAVLDGVSFAAGDGEFVALLGPSGCGKSTLLRVIAGLETADSGRVLIGGREVTALAPKSRDLAFVFQSYDHYPHMTAAENVETPLKLRGVPRAERERLVRETAEHLGLSELLARRPGQLSGGQRQRVALARALVRRPKAFLLDEPLSNLDAVLRERTRGELKLLFARERGTVLYVTHDQAEAMSMSDRVVVLNDGRVQQDGPPEELYRRPANVFVAGFLGSPAMSFLREGDRLVGIRPEDVIVAAEPTAGLEEWKVELAEPLGAQTVLTLARDGKTIRASVPGDWDRRRPRAYARLPPERLHMFDGKSGARLG